MKIRVYYEDTDAGGIVFHSKYINFCERARSEFFFENNIFFDKGYFVVKSLSANYISPAKLGDIIEVKTKVKTIKNASIVLLQEIYKEKLIFSMTITLVYMQNDKISKIPQYMIEIINKIQG